MDGVMSGVGVVALVPTSGQHGNHWHSKLLLKMMLWVGGLLLTSF
jgi:hypothetical protein